MEAVIKSLPVRKMIVAFLIFVLASGAFLYVKNGRLALTPKKRLLTQLSDNEAFRHICRSAIVNPQVFSEFKRDPVYTLFHENVSLEQGRELYTYLESHAPDFLNAERMEKFRTEDSLGGPITCSLGEIGEISPTTLRAIKIAHDIQTHFGSLQGCKVIEIGAGHGLQCKILRDLYPEVDYTIVDLPDSLELAKKTLTLLGVNGVHFVTPDQLPSGQFDLVLSTYTFTESGMGLQERYFKKLIKNAKQGYLLCNFFGKHFRVRPWNREQLLKKFMTLPVELELLPEMPQTGPDNFVLVWR